MMMQITRVSRWVRFVAIALSVAICGGASRTLARVNTGHADHDDAMTPQPPMTAEQVAVANALVQTVREATGPFQTPEQLPRGFNLMFGCVSGGEFGAMGLHYVNLARVTDGLIDPSNPEIVLYEPTPDGRKVLTGADYLVFAADWDAKHPNDPPQLAGQLFHFFESPNRFGLPAFYTLHVWAWKDNPNGTFTNWNPTVSCDGFSGQP
jgi:hypothetical protein